MRTTFFSETPQPPGYERAPVPTHLIEEILRSRAAAAAAAHKSGDSGNYIREFDTGRMIGNLPISKGGQPTSVVTIITDRLGNLVNTFPGTLGRRANL